MLIPFAFIWAMVSGTIHQGLNKVYSGYEVVSHNEIITVPSVIRCAMRCNISTTCVTATFDVLSKQCQLSADSLMSTIKTNDSKMKTITSTGEVPVCWSPPDIANGALTVTSYSSMGSEAMLACNNGYFVSLISPVYVKCSVGSGWDDTNNVACVDTLPSPVGYFGTSFVTAFMKNAEDSGAPYIIIACNGIATVRVEIPGLTVDAVHVVTNKLELSVSNVVTHMTSGAIEDKAVFVTSDIPIVLYSANLLYGSADGSLVLPRHVLSNEYFTIGYESSLDQFVIIALKDATDVTIDYAVSSLDTFTMNENQTYFKQGSGLSGTRISASSPIFVLSSHLCANIPDLVTGYCDYIAETALPVTSLGTIHIVSYMHPRPDFTISVVATQSYTAVSIYDKDGNVIENINNLMLKTTIFRTYTNFKTISVISNKPVMVYQYGHGAGGATGDPSLMFVPDVRLYGERYEFVIPSGFINCALAIVISDSFSVCSLELNGNEISSTERVDVFVPHVGMYHVIYIDVQPGYYTLSCTSSPGVAIFGAWVYGRKIDTEFAWALGVAV